MEPFLLIWVIKIMVQTKYTKRIYKNARDEKIKQVFHRIQCIQTVWARFIQCDQVLE